jgi:ankyrin repeat protein
MQVDGWTALHMAAANGHTDTVKALLAAGANVFATAVRGLASRVCVCVAARNARIVSACSLAVRATWARCGFEEILRGSFASVVSSAVENSALW